MKKFIYTAVSLCTALLGAVSCEFAEPEWVTPIALGAKNPVIELSTIAPGDSNFNIVSNCEYKVVTLQGEEWLTVTEAAARTINFTFTQNNGFKRSAKVEISAPGRKDTLVVKQPGMYFEYINIPAEQKTHNVTAQGAILKVDFATNILLKNLTYETTSAQISNVSISKNSVYFEVLPTTSRDNRSFTLSVYALDGWGDKVSGVVTINQSKLQ